jgi:hypothetical protein
MAGEVADPGPAGEQQPVGAAYDEPADEMEPRLPHGTGLVIGHDDDFSLLGPLWQDGLLLSSAYAAPATGGSSAS